MVIIKNLHLWGYFESTSDFRVLRSFNYDKIHIQFKFIESRFISFIYRDFPQKNPKFTSFVFLSKQMIGKNLPH